MDHPVEPTAGQPARRTPLVPLPSPEAGGRAWGPHPLPDAAAIRTVTVPDSAPPYDDSLTRGSGRERPVRLPGGSAPNSRGEYLWRVGPGGNADASAGGPGDRSGPSGPGSPGGPGDPSGDGDRDLARRAWPSRFAQVLAESLAGSRPSGQLTPWTTEQTRQRIRQLGPILATGDQPRIRRVIVSSPDHGVLEMTVVVGLGSRVRALAVRLEEQARLTRQAGRPAPGKAGGRVLAAAGPASAASYPAAMASPWFCTAVEAA